MKKYTAAVIGGGPSGSFAAKILAENGINVLLLEQKKKPGYPVCCGEAVSKRVIEQLNLISLIKGNKDKGIKGCMDKEVKGFRVFFNAAPSAYNPEQSRRIPNGKFFSVDTPGYLINRQKFDAVLFSQAKESGADVFSGQKVTAIIENSFGFEVHTKEKQFNADFIIGADGPSSFIDRTFFSNHTTLIPALQFKLPKPQYSHSSEDYIDFFYHSLSKYYFWIFEKENEINAGGSVENKNVLEKFVRAEFNLNKNDKIDYSFYSRGLIPVSGIKKQIRRDRIFLTGDAAGLTNPVSFAGIYTALISARICADTIINHLKENKPLSLYEKNTGKYIFAKKIIKEIGSRCYEFPAGTLNFIGDYFNGRVFRTKDVLKFIKMSVKQPSVFKDILALARHRQLLRYHVDELW